MGCGLWAVGYELWALTGLAAILTSGYIRGCWAMGYGLWAMGYELTPDT